MPKHLTLKLSLIYGLGLSGLVGYNLADTFLIAHTSGSVATTEEDFDFDDTTTTSTTTQEETSSTTTTEETSSSSGRSHSHHKTDDEETSSSTVTEDTSSTEVTDTTTSETKVTFTKSTKEIDGDDVTYYLADVQLKKLSDLRTRVALDSSGNYGSNITESFSELISDASTASRYTPLVAISGDFCFWKSRSGYVIRNGATYRTDQRSDTDVNNFAIFKDGSTLSYAEDDYTFNEINSMNNGCYQNWCFGPSLIKDGKIAVSTTEEIDGQSMSNNQRTAIGFAGSNHFYFLSTTVDGSRQKGTGFSLYNLAEVLLDNGCTEAYNLDGGGSASFYYGGKTYVSPNRELGDIIYVINS